MPTRTVRPKPGRAGSALPDPALSGPALPDPALPDPALSGPALPDPILPDPILPDRAARPLRSGGPPPHVFGTASGPGPATARPRRRSGRWAGRWARRWAGRWAGPHPAYARPGSCGRSGAARAGSRGRIRGREQGVGSGQQRQAAAAMRKGKEARLSCRCLQAVSPVAAQRRPSRLLPACHPPQTDPTATPPAAIPPPAAARAHSSRPPHPTAAPDCNARRQRPTTTIHKRAPTVTLTGGSGRQFRAGGSGLPTRHRLTATRPPAVPPIRCGPACGPLACSSLAGHGPTCRPSPRNSQAPRKSQAPCSPRGSSGKLIAATRGRAAGGRAARPCAPSQRTRGPGTGSVRPSQPEARALQRLDPLALPPETPAGLPPSSPTFLTSPSSRPPAFLAPRLPDPRVRRP